jgi:signal transduction histidine kinase/ActR/RegA family two-component response regulator
VEEVLGLKISRDVYAVPIDCDTVLQEIGFGSAKTFMGVEVRWKRKDLSPITVRLSGRIIKEEAGRAVAYEAVAEDVTERALLEQQLRQAQKMEAVGRLAGGVAHDFNNLLMIVSSYAELLERRSHDEVVLNYTAQIRNATDNAAGVARQLLAFSRQQVFETTILDLNHVLADLSKMLPRILGEDVEMVLAPAADLSRVRADRSQIEQVIMNLVVNARDAMPQGGRLVLETANVEIDQGYTCRRPQVSPGKYVMLAVSDAGIGMDQETQARIFEPFFTTKDAGKGAGLGLSTVYGIVKQSGGSIWVYSEPGQGSIFRVYLPAVEEAATQPAELARPEEVPGGRETILLVEDETALREVTKEFLELKGYAVLPAANGADALTICERHKQPIHLLVTDLVMPGIRGPELAQKAMKVHPEIRALFMSGYADRSEEIQQLGPQAMFLQKPFPLVKLAQKLRLALLESKETAGSAGSTNSRR